MDDLCGAMVQMDMDGTITSWNESAENILGFTSSEVVGRNGFEMIFVTSSENEDMLSMVTIGEVFYSFESYLKNKSGDMQPVALVTSPISNDEGKTIGFTVLISNILLI
jgi:PAS domain S-box-containing protein